MSKDDNDQKKRKSSTLFKNDEVAARNTLTAKKEKRDSWQDTNNDSQNNQVGVFSTFYKFAYNIYKGAVKHTFNIEQTLPNIIG